MVKKTILNWMDSRPQVLQGVTYSAWVVFVVCGIWVAAYCISLIFISQGHHFPMNIFQLAACLALLRLLSIFLARQHVVLGSQALEFERAVGHFQWALRLRPSHYEAYNQWGLRALAQSDFGSARTYFEMARSLCPEDEGAYKNLARLSLVQGNTSKACDLFDEAYRIGRGIAWNDHPENIPAAAKPQTAYFIETSRMKLNHDLQQLNFLLEGKYLPEKFQTVQTALQNLLRDLSAKPEAHQGLFKLSAKQSRGIEIYYGRNIYFAPVPAFPSSVLAADLDPERLTAEFQQKRMIFWDDFLRPDVLEALYHFCLKSTIWHDDHRPGGYLGSYMDDGFNCELLYQIVQEVQGALPGIFKGAPLKHMWAYKYDSQYQGIGLHADDAKLNLNFWITPDHANLDPDSGGLIVYDVAAPEHWNFRAMNIETEKMEAWIAQNQGQPRKIPYRQNRAILFDSRLFHVTDALHFKSGYTSRRINITFLYG